MKTRDFS